MHVFILTVLVSSVLFACTRSTHMSVCCGRLFVVTGVYRRGHVNYKQGVFRFWNSHSCYQLEVSVGLLFVEVSHVCWDACHVFVTVVTCGEVNSHRGVVSRHWYFGGITTLKRSFVPSWCEMVRGRHIMYLNGHLVVMFTCKTCKCMFCNDYSYGWVTYVFIKTRKMIDDKHACNCSM